MITHPADFEESLPLFFISVKACILHLINSVGQITREAKIAAKLPATAVCSSLDKKCVLNFK